MRREIFLPVLLAFALRLLLFIYIAFYNPSFMIQPDSPSYINPALNLLERKEFVSGRYPDLKPETFRTPGYPLFIALSYLLFGRKVESVIILQIILGALFPLLAWKIAEELNASLRVRRISAYLSALDPLLLIYTVNVLTEELYAFVVALLLFLCLKLLREPNSFYLSLASLLSGLQAYIRPIGVFLPGLLFLYFLFLKRFKSAFVILLVSYILIFGWAYRNWKETGILKFSTISGANMYFYRSAYVLQFERGESWVKIQEDLKGELEKRSKGLSEAQRLSLAERMGFEIMLSHPISALKAFLRGVLGTLAGPGGAYYLVAFKFYKPGSGILNKLYELGFLRFLRLLWDEYRYVFLVNLLFGIYFLFLYLSSVWGFYKNLFKPDAWLLVLLILYFLVVSAGPEAYSRFRVPFELPIIILSSLAFERGRASSTGFYLS